MESLLYLLSVAVTFIVLNRWDISIGFRSCVKVPLATSLAICVSFSTSISAAAKRLQGFQLMPPFPSLALSASPALPEPSLSFPFLLISLPPSLPLAPFHVPSILPFLIPLCLLPLSPSPLPPPPSLSSLSLSLSSYANFIPQSRVSCEKSLALYL